MNVRISWQLIAQLTLILASAATAIASPLILPDSGSLTGIVSSVDTDAKLVFLLDGKIIMDASNATIQSTRGPEPFTSVVVGAEVSALINPGTYAAGAPLKASVINVVSRPSTLLSGRVEAVDVVAQTLTVFGQVIQVTSRTRYTTHIGGAQPRGIEDLLPNQVIVVELSQGLPALTAERVTIIQPAAGPVVSFYGQIISIQGQTWTVSPNGSLGTVFRVTASTNIVGNPQVGDYVTVTARLEAGGYTAIAISIASPPAPPVRGVRLVGKLTELTQTHLVITDPNLQQTRFTVNVHTQFNGSPKVGDQVVVIGEVQASGELIATRVEKEFTPSPISRIFTIVGTVTSMRDTEWVVGRFTVLISPRTSISGQIEIGDRVRVVGERQFNTMVIVAYEIHKE